MSPACSDDVLSSQSSSVSGAVSTSVSHIRLAFSKPESEKTISRCCELERVDLNQPRSY